MRIRNYEAGDLGACRGLWVALTQWHRDIYGSPTIGGDDPGRYFDEHLARVGPGNIWVAEGDDGVVIGMTGLIDGDEPELEPLVVAEGHRGSGVGRELAQAVIERVRQGGARDLKVRPVGRNADAIRAFHALGFTNIAHVDLFMDLRDKPGPWRAGERLADRDFEI